MPIAGLFRAMCLPFAGGSQAEEASDFMCALPGTSAGDTGHEHAYERVQLRRDLRGVSRFVTAFRAQS
jgi:hypothetical protein